jgi:hypothetical protein
LLTAARTSEDAPAIGALAARSGAAGQRGDPSPWLGGDVSAKTGVQLSAFAAIDELAAALGEQHRGAIQKIVRKGAGELLSEAIQGSKLEFE